MKFNILEKKALLGIIILGGLFILSIFYVGKRNLWFEPKVHFKTKIHDADGLRVGAVVTLAGLRVGDVTKLSVADDNLIVVTFSVKKSLSQRITDKSIAKLHRTFLIGEKRVDLVPSSEGRVLSAGEFLQGRDSTEIADMLSGKNVNSIFAKLSGLQKSMEVWASSFTALSENVKPEEIVAIYKMVGPTLVSVKKFTDEMLEAAYLSSEIRAGFMKNKLAQITVSNANKILAPLAQREKLLKDALNSISILTSELSNYPEFARDLVETLKETSTTLKAIQKTWMLRDHVNDVKKEKK